MIYIEVGRSIISSTQQYYKIVKYMGQGGNAYVYKVLCTSGHNCGIVFALKLQYNLSNETRRKRFERESQFLKRCSHPAILQQFDEGVYTLPNGEEYPFIITSFLPDTLGSAIKKNQLSLLQKIQYSCQLLSALNFLKDCHILHRDIKPNNIFLTHNTAILGDFGLMKAMSSYEFDNEDDIVDDINLIGETLLANEDKAFFNGYVAMAKYYRTPELVAYARGEAPLHIASDVFQLGLVLCELYTGSNPLQPAFDLRSPIQMNQIEFIEADIYGHVIHDTLASMLILNSNQRATPQQLLDKFTGIYQELLLNLAQAHTC